jgi:hypothetical protein|tara:strand:+ start:41 stop:340 length:300 start_codon:yes stop_codon:yes gene_type:complete
MVKIILTWDIKLNLEQEYFDFIVREFVPGITQLGIKPTDAWYTLYGECSQILTAGVVETKEQMQEILNSDEWESLETRLLDFVDNLEHKVVEARQGFQL